MALTVPNPMQQGMSLADAIKARVGCDYDGIPSGSVPASEASNRASNPAEIRGQNCPILPAGMPTLAGEVEAWHPKS